MPIEITLSGDEVDVAADADLVRAAITNLLLNAVQAMAGAGRIEVTVAFRDEMGFVEVRDTGPGIPPAIRTPVFEPFFTLTHLTALASHEIPRRFAKYSTAPSRVASLA